MPKKRLLITGASGLLGDALCRQAENAYEVYGVCLNNPVTAPGAASLRIDLTDTAQIKQGFEEIRPQAVIHAAAFSNPNDCEQQPDESDRVNLRASEAIVRLCAEMKIPLVFTSSDLVFDGEGAPYKEDAPVAPICVYGRHKAAAESAVREIHPAAAVCRLPLLLGCVPGAGSGFLGHMVQTLRAKKPLTLFTDEFRTPVDTDSAAKGLLMALENQGALLHLGGQRRMSRYTMGCLVADILKADHALLKPLRIVDLPMAAPRSPDVSLESSRAYALGYAPGDLIAYLEKTLPRM